MSTEIQTVQPEISAQQTSLYLLEKASIDTQIATAKAFPRSLSEFRKKALSMATLSEEIAASCCYALPRGGKPIEGPSIRLAEIIQSSYGNIRSGARIIENDGKTITAQGICHDLENNICVTKEVKRRITGKNGQTFTEDMQIVTGNAACSIALRNAIFSVVPASLATEIYDQAKEVSKGTLATLVDRRSKALEYFKTLKVSEKQICEALEVKGIEEIDLDKLQTLTGFRMAIKNGESTVKDIFEKPEPADASELLSILQANEASFHPDEYKAMKAILTNKKTAEFEKVDKRLKEIIGG